MTYDVLCYLLMLLGLASPDGDLACGLVAALLEMLLFVICLLWELLVLSLPSLSVYCELCPLDAEPGCRHSRISSCI